MEVDHPMRESSITGDGEMVGRHGVFASCCLRLRSLLHQLGYCRVAGKVRQIAREDPRRVTHSLKVGLALTLVSLVYFVRPLFNGLGDSTMWAVLTVVVVMEFTVGGTLSKGLNRALATLVAGCIAVGAHKLAEVAERWNVQGEPILLTVFVFFIASAATFSRFIPEVKARYDYGVTIFILTFSLVAVSSYRVEELIQLAHQRFYTIIVGVFICLCTTIFVFPVWAGEDLHKLAAGNLDKLAEFLEGMESKCFGENTAIENLEEKGFVRVYMSILDSKATEDSLCTFAKWEPGHGKFRFRHPWSQYQKLGALCRQCASSMDALASYLIATTKSQHRPSAISELSIKVLRLCGEMSSQSAKALRELSTVVRTSTAPSPASVAMREAIEAAEDVLRGGLISENDAVPLVQVAVAASLLADLVTQIKDIAGSVDDLARAARFESPRNAKDDVVIDVVRERGREAVSDGPRTSSSRTVPTVVAVVGHPPNQLPPVTFHPEVPNR